MSGSTAGPDSPWWGPRKGIDVMPEPAPDAHLQPSSLVTLAAGELVVTPASAQHYR